MEDDTLVKRRQVSEIFKEKFQSLTVQRHHQVYIDHLHGKLNQWKSETNEKVKQFIKEKIQEIDQFYTEYCQEMNEKYADINRQIENTSSSSARNNQIENFNTYCQSNTIENCLRLQTKLFSKEQLIENIQLEFILYPSPSSEPIMESPESSIEERTIEPSESIIKERTVEPSESVIKERTIEPSKSIIREIRESVHSPHTSSRESPVPVDRTPIQDYSKAILHEDDLVLESQSSPLPEQSFIPLQKSITITTNDNVPKTITRLYVGKHHILTPVLVGKDREVSNETEKLTEYSIDSIPIVRNRQEQSSNSNSDPDNDMKLVHAYKVLIQEENAYQRISTASSDHETEEDADEEYDEELANLNKKFHLKNVDQMNYSTIMFRKCETEYNCISSSTQRNELILYNSKLKVLIILQHEEYQQCRHRFYLHWPTNLSSNISDITYCQNNDHFLISTWDTSHIYLFNRHLLALNDLGTLLNDCPLRRIHCYQQTIYCILGNNYLLEYQIDDQYSYLTIIRKIQLFNPFNHSQETVYHLLDLTCDENYLIIIYSNEHDEIHLQSIYKQTREFHQDLLLDHRQPINQNYIRIESTNTNGHFLYLNGSQQHLKAIDLINYNKGKITSMMRRHTKPTNISFLKDQRLVILYEHPYFLSVHDTNNRPEGN